MRVINAALLFLGVFDLVAGQTGTTPAMVVATLKASMMPHIDPGTGQAIIGVDEPPPPPEVSEMRAAALSWISEQQAEKDLEIELRPTTAPWKPMPVPTTPSRGTTSRPTRTPTPRPQPPANRPIPRPPRPNDPRPNVTSRKPVVTMGRPDFLRPPPQRTPLATMSRFTPPNNPWTTRKAVVTMSRFPLLSPRQPVRQIRKRDTAPTRNRHSELNRRQATSDRGCIQRELNLLNYIPNDPAPDAFILDPWMLTTADSYYIPPAGYHTLFQGQAGALRSEARYMGYHQLASYSPSSCAAFCDRETDCAGFNIYFERNPLFAPNDKTCLNPSARGAVTCALYGGNPRQFRADETNNFGQWRNDFMLTITGSNGYIKNPLPVKIKNFRPPQPLYGAIDPDSNLGASEFIDAKILNTQDGAQEICAKFCRDTTAANRANARSGRYRPCNYYNTFNLAEAGWNYKWTYCVLYTTRSIASSGFVNTFLHNNAPLNVTYSHGVALSPPDSGIVDIPWEPIPEGSAASCASMARKYGSRYRSYNDKSYSFSCGHDVQYAADVGSETSSDFFSCFEKCDDFEGCDGFSFAFGSCWFKKLTGQSRTPQVNSAVDMAWLSNGYLGFEASKLAATVTYPATPTIYVPGTGSVRTRTSFIDGLTGVIVVSTPVVARATTQYVTVTTERAIAGSTPRTVTGNADRRRVATVTVTYPRPTHCSNNRKPRYYTYRNIHRNFQVPGYPQFSPEAYKARRPENPNGNWADFLGIWRETTGTRSDRYDQYDTDDFDAAFSVISHQFYVYANRGTGFYHFNIPYTDDIALVWFWDNALSGWTRDNAQFVQTYTPSRPSSRPLTYSFFLNAGAYIPVRIMWANGLGAANFAFNILGPDGSTISTTDLNHDDGDLSYAVVFRPCDAALGAPFPTWQRET